MNSSESIFYWTTALLHAATFISILLAVIFKKAAPFKVARAVFFLAFVTITIFGIIRWVRTGHPPFVTMFESMIAAIWFIMLIYHLFRVKFECINIAILPASLITLMMMGWSSSMSNDATPLSAALTNVWLFIHASFATAGAAAFLIAASLATLFLMGEERLNQMEKIATKVPIYNDLPRGVQNFTLFGLILWGVMIISGSIWANIAWNRYWAWDPIELWSLISWLLYGVIFHLHLAIGFKKRIYCWATIFAALTIVFSLWGVQYLYKTIHTYG